MTAPRCRHNPFDTNCEKRKPEPDLEPEPIEPRARPPLSYNDNYAAQHHDLMQYSGGRSTLQDATLGKEYDIALEKALLSTDPKIREFAESMRKHAHKQFDRMHSHSPVPVR